MTWAANVLVLIGLVLIGRKKRVAFLYTLAGESLWCVAGCYRGMWDLAGICAVFAILAAANWYQWRPRENDT